MIYSPSKNAIFCFPCMLFHSSASASCYSASAFFEPSKGYSDWCRVSRAVSNHENSREHGVNYMMWRNLDNRLAKGINIDKDIEKVILNEKETWRMILKVVVDIIMYWAKNNLPLRRSTDDIGKSHCEIFQNTVELISHYYPVLRTHIENIQEKNGSMPI